LDFNFRNQTNQPAEMTKAFKSNYGQRFLIPAEYDVMIDVGPSGDDPNISNQSECTQGNFKF
jgi:hypothetical protein